MYFGDYLSVYVKNYCDFMSSCKRILEFLVYIVLFKSNLWTKYNTSTLPYKTISSYDTFFASNCNQHQETENWVENFWIFNDWHL